MFSFSSVYSCDTNKKRAWPRMWSWRKHSGDTCGDTAATGTKKKKKEEKGTYSRPHCREPLLTCQHHQHNNNNDIYFDLKTDTTPSEHNKSWGRELASWDKSTHTVHTDTHLHMLENRGRLENDRGKLCDLWKRGSLVKKVKSGKCKQKPNKSRGKNQSMR